MESGVSQSGEKKKCDLLQFKFCNKNKKRHSDDNK